MSVVCRRSIIHNSTTRSFYSIIKTMSTTSGAVPILYTFSGSGNSYRIRLLQVLLGIDIKHEELDFLVSSP